MPLTGDFAELKALIGKLAEVDNRVVPEATKAAGAELTAQYQADFSGGRDPWGGVWKAPKTGGRPNFRTGRLANPQIIIKTAAVQIKPEPYWVFPQIGANNAPKNAVLPFSASRWDAPVQERIENVVIGHFR